VPATSAGRGARKASQRPPLPPGVEPRGNPSSDCRRRTPPRSISVRGSAGRTTEVVRGADADKARTGASRRTQTHCTEHDPRYVRRPDAEGERSGHARFLPPPLPRLGVPSAWAVGGLPRGFSTVSTCGQADAQGGQGLRTERIGRRGSRGRKAWCSIGVASARTPAFGVGRPSRFTQPT
jgi:hypothetical protein